MSSDPQRDLLRHTLATLAYRAAKVLRAAPPDFAAFRPTEGCHTPLEIVAHLSDLLDWALSIAQGRQQWTPSTPSAWDAEVQRFFTALSTFDDRLASAEVHAPVENLFQGPVADALTHVGQLALLRRMAGAPIRGENYFVAEIKTGNLASHQAAPRREFD
jgi:hypothetical protein